MNLRGIVNKAPNAVLIICATVLALGVLGSYVFLNANGKDAADISRFVNTALNFLMLILGGVSATAASAAARSSEEAKQSADKTVTQTNGPLTERLAAIEGHLDRLNPPD